MKQKLDKIDLWKAEKISGAIEELQGELGLGRSDVLRILRYAVSGSAPGVAVPDMMEILGKQRVVDRLEKSVPPQSGK
jgi:glutamyl/glutaminyl-tRNA synthetase